MRRRSFQFFLFAFIVTILTPLQSSGLDLAIVGVYICRATEINEAAVKECVSHYPALADRASAVWSSWRERNAAEAEKAAQQCSDEIHKQFPVQEEFDKVQVKMKEIESEILDSIPKSVQSEGENFCKQFLTSLENGESDLSRLLNNK